MAEWICLFVDDEMDTPVSPPAIVGILKTQWTIFSVTGCRAIDGKPQLPKIGQHISCSAFAQHEIIRRRAEVIAAPFQNEAGRSVVLQVFGVSVQGTHRLHPERVLIKIE